MRIKISKVSSGQRILELIDDAGTPIPEAAAFVRFLQARGSSPHTVAGYLYDLRRFFDFLRGRGLTPATFTLGRAPDFLVYLSAVRSSAKRRPFYFPSVVGSLSPTTINRTLAAVSTFYEHLILTAAAGITNNPLASPGGEISRMRGRRAALRSALRLRRVVRIPRPMTDLQVKVLLRVTKRIRDRSMILLMLQGGLRAGEVLNLHLDYVQYGRRRVLVRFREDHPKGVRTKSRVERAVDLFEDETLRALSDYVLNERPRDAGTEYLFLIGGAGRRRAEPLGYPALAKMFKRRCQEAELDEPWITTHALRHTHATRMWEGGMREMALQKRLGHLAFESTQAYTRVSDTIMLADYKRALAALKRTAAYDAR